MAWENVGEGGGGDFLKITAGTKVKLHILSEEPYSVWQFFNSALKKSCVVPDGFKTDKKLRRQHTFAVFVLDTKEVKLFSMGNQLAGEIKNINDTYGGLTTVDLVIGRTGSGLDTKYSVVPIQTKYNDDMIAELTVPDPSEIMKVSDEATIMSVMGDDSNLGFPAPEETLAEPAPEEAVAPIQEELETPAPRPVAKVAPKAAPVKATGGDPRIALIRVVMHAFASKPKFKDPKVRMALLKKVGSKTIVSQLSIDELKKLQPLLK